MHKKVAIIIGFAYNAVKTSSLSIPSTLMDIYLAYNHAESIGCSSLVITDNTEKEINSYIEKMIVEGVIDVNIGTFISELSNKQELYHFRDVKNLLNILREKTINSVNVFIYYSGHGLNGDLIFPCYTHRGLYYEEILTSNVSLSVLLNTISSSMNKNGEIFLLLDMCDSNVVKLPYIYISDSKPHYKFQGLENCCIMDGRRIMCFSEMSDIALSVKEGSIYTLKFFNSLRENGGSLCPNENTILASYPNMTNIPFWMQDKSNNSFWLNSGSADISLYLI